MAKVELDKSKNVLNKAKPKGNILYISNKKQLSQENIIQNKLQKIPKKKNTSETTK